MCPKLVLPIPGAFLQWPLTILTRQTRQAVPGINQSIFLDFRCLWINTSFLIDVQILDGAEK
jgi:hypothetical protein